MEVRIVDARSRQRRNLVEVRRESVPRRTRAAVPRSAKTPRSRPSTRFAEKSVLSKLAVVPRQPLTPAHSPGPAAASVDPRGRSPDGGGANPGTLAGGAPADSARGRKHAGDHRRGGEVRTISGKSGTDACDPCCPPRRASSRGLLREGSDRIDRHLTLSRSSSSWGVGQFSRALKPRYRPE